MTRNEFWEALAELQCNNWRALFSGKTIRLRHPAFSEPACPVSAVASYKTGRFYSTLEWIDAIEVLHLSHAFARKVMNAADGRIGLIRDRLTHRRLLEILVSEMAVPI